MPKKTESQLVSIAVDDVHDHPNNPRVVFRDDVIDGIATNLTGEYPQHHAITVRQNGDGYQLISGHHRIRAARKAGLSNVWAFVRDVDDESAFMELATSNNQGELAPLERGLHQLGSGLGSTEYASRVGQAKQNANRERSAAEVALGSNLEITRLLEKSNHLYAIHHCEKGTWPLLVRTMLDKGWSAADTEHWCGRVREFAIPDKWSAFLPLVDVVSRFIETKEFSPKTVAQLCALADSITSTIEALDGDVARLLGEFDAWLTENKGAAAWDVRKLREYQEHLLASQKKRETELASRWLHGNWRDHAPALGDGAVSLLLTDPPYGIDFQSDYRLDRRSSRKNERIANDGALDAIAELSAMLAAMFPKLSQNASVLVFCHWANEPEVREAVRGSGLAIRNSIVWKKNNTGMGDPKTTFAPMHERIVFAVKGSPTLYERLPDVLEFDRVSSERHPTEKPVDLLSGLIGALTVEGSLVADPFGGVASSLVAAAELKRAFWGCELDETYHARGMERLR